MTRVLSPADVLSIFVKVPEPGRVKTRLAAAIGADRATALYRAMGRMVVEQCVAPGPYRTVVWFALAGGETAVRSWLDPLEVDGFLRQPDHGLGGRLRAAFERHLADGASRVVVIGSDCPTLARPLIRQAFRALERADLVIGPARDGGFYLLGLRSSAPGLFRHIEWSTDSVYRQVMLNAARLGLSATVLPELRDVDTVADARALGLLEPGSLPWNGNRNGLARGA